MKSWFSITNKAEASAAEILLFEEIGLWGITSRDFAVAFGSIPAEREIVVGINSPGGDVFQGWAIYNLLAARREKITVRIDGVAASIAAVIAMAGKKIIMPPASLMMIHNASAGNFGESEELRQTAAVLDKINTQSIEIFAKRTGKSEDEIRALMPAGKDFWMSPAEAKELGFCDEISGGSAAKAVANFDFRRFKNGPKPVDDGKTKQEGQPPTSDNTQMKSLLVALAAAGLIPSADASEEVAVSTFQKNFAPFKAASDKLPELQSKFETLQKSAAESAITGAVMAGKIKDDKELRAKWVAAYIQNPDGTQAMLDGMEAKQQPKGSAPIPPQKGAKPGENPNPSGETEESLRAKLGEETDPVKRGLIARELREVRGHKDLFKN